MKIEALILIGFVLASSFGEGCGLDWSLPTNHFDGMEEHGYVSYWEKIGEADLGDDLVISVNVNFNSHREASSPTLGKGWMVALLESHVEPLDENCLKVIMPDGWNFYFYRQGNTDTWQGNSKWVGETKGSIFVITSPCSWRIRFDGGKIQEIDSGKNRVLSYKYNGPVATEIDVDGKAFVQVENNPATGLAQDIRIGGQKVSLSETKRPQVMAKLTQNLVTGFDLSLSQLQWADGKKESFAFGTDSAINPSLAITHADQTKRSFTWDATTRQIKTDDGWTYNLSPGGYVALNRTDVGGRAEIYSTGAGVTLEQGIDGVTRVTTTFVNAGPLSGKIRKIELIENGNKRTIYQASYDELGNLTRENKSGVIIIYNKVAENILYDGGTSILDLVAIDKRH